MNWLCYFTVVLFWVEKLYSVLTIYILPLFSCCHYTKISLWNIFYFFYGAGHVQCGQSEMKIMKQREKAHSLCDPYFKIACSHFSYLFQRDAHIAFPFVFFCLCFQGFNWSSTKSSMNPFSCVWSHLQTCYNAREQPLYCFYITFNKWNQAVCFLCLIKKKTKTV